MNTNRNTYTFIYASVLVVIVAALLAYVSGSLQERQQRNIDTEKQLNILSSAHLATDAANASNKISYVTALFKKHVRNAYVVNYKGEVVDGDAFETEMKTQYELMKEARKEELRLPVFECTLDNGTLLYVVPCYGQGLWGPIWGYIALRDDCNTLYGAVFDHSGETPGLGSQIATPKYVRQFVGKTIFEHDRFVSISVVKGGAKPDDAHAVDAISGGTITSKALEKLLFTSLEAYVPFFENQNKP